MAKTEHYYTKFEKGNFYHVYNRSVDRKPMFKNEDNYLYFFKKYLFYLSPVVDTYGYCLMGNHFHILMRVRDDADTALLTVGNVIHNVLDMDILDVTTFQKLSNPKYLEPKQKTTHDIVSHQFRNFFQSYAMAFNKQQDRIGTLFQTPFKRALVDSDSYFTKMVYYIHANPQKHGILADFRDWPWSSYRSFLSNKPTALQREAVLDWFSGANNFTQFHAIYQQSLTDTKFDLDEEGDY